MHLRVGMSVLHCNRVPTNMSQRKSSSLQAGVNWGMMRVAFSLSSTDGLLQLNCRDSGFQPQIYLLYFVSLTDMLTSW